MSKLSNAIYEINYIDELSQRKTWINSIHPLIKLLVTIIYISIVVSFNKYDLFGLVPMVLYIVIIFSISETPFLLSLKKIWVVLPIVCFVGIFNPFFDHSVYLSMGNWIITGGMVSAFTLIIKGVLTVFASYLLIATTNIEKLCYALRCLHIPDVFVTQILLTYRYITLLLGQAHTIMEAYSLRAPNQKGIRFKVWGSLIGQLLFRSIDRARDLYDSMVLRGYKGEFFYDRKGKVSYLEILYLLGWILFFFAVRRFHIVGLIGQLFV